MGRIADLFLRKKKNVLNVYVTAGFPALDSTLTVMKALQDAGADMIELGMPYSDPLADGPVIQASNGRALLNGMTIQTLFEQLKNFRSVIHVPVLLMGYMNPILQYGFERFCLQAAESGIDGLILLDLPVFEFEKEFAVVTKKHQLDFVFLITPETSDVRIQQLDKSSSGFLYAVSSSSTTGNFAVVSDQEVYFRKLKSLALTNPVLIGFGIRDKQSFSNACLYANGAIIGTAFIQAVENISEENIPKQVKAFIQSLS